VVAGPDIASEGQVARLVGDIVLVGIVVSNHFRIMEFVVLEEKITVVVDHDNIGTAGTRIFGMLGIHSVRAKFQTYHMNITNISAANTGLAVIFQFGARASVTVKGDDQWLFITAP